MKIVSVLKPFLMQQNIFVYDNMEVVEIIPCFMENYEDTFLETAKKYGISEAELIGSKNYTKGIKNKIESAELNKYSENTINIILK